MTMLQDYLNEINQYNVRPAWPKPSRCALLVIDMQQYFLSIAAPILGNVLSIIETCRSVDIRTIFTRHGHKEVTKDGGMLAEWWGDLIEYRSKEWELIKALKPSNTDGVINKDRYSVFHGTGLDDSLKSRKIEELIIVALLLTVPHCGTVNFPCQKINL